MGNLPLRTLWSGDGSAGAIQQLHMLTPTSDNDVFVALRIDKNLSFIRRHLETTKIAVFNVISREIIEANHLRVLT